MTRSRPALAAVLLPLALVAACSGSSRPVAVPPPTASATGVPTAPAPSTSSPAASPSSPATSTVRPTSPPTATARPTPPPATPAPSPSRPQQAGPVASATPVPSGPVRLTLAPASGPPGTTITFTAHGCSRPAGGYRAVLADSRALAHPQDPSLRHRATVLGAQSGRVTARLTLPAGTAPGPAFAQVTCGGSRNATALFLVTPR